MSKSETYDFEKICRLCLAEKRTLSPIFSKRKSDKKVPLPVMIMSCASLEMYEGDGFPASICNKCLVAVSQSYAFKEQCEQADSKLRQIATKQQEDEEEEEEQDMAEPLPLEETEEKDDDLIGDDSYTTRAESKQEKPGSPEVVDCSVSEVGACWIKEEVVANCDEWEYSEVEVDPDMDMIVLLEPKSEVVDGLEDSGEHVAESMSQKTAVENISELFRSLEQTRLVRAQMLQTTASKPKHKGKTPATGTLVDSNRVYCSQCNIFMLKSSYYGHNRYVHNKHRGFLCTNCGYRAATGTILRQHIQAVHVGYTFQCKQCPQKFNRAQRLRKHVMYDHEGKVVSKNFICQYCAMAFCTNAALARHLRSHTQETPYSCQYCGRKFKYRWPKVQHERLHTGEKPYQCTMCDERFTQNCVRKAHEFKAHGNAKYAPKVTSMAAAALKRRKTPQDDRPPDELVSTSSSDDS